jgi:hypothetical protein
MRCLEVLSLTFGENGNAADCLGGGWSVPEEGETWCIGPYSSLVLPAPQRAVPHVLTFDLRPHLQAHHLTEQRLAVRVGGIKVASFRITDRTTRSCVIPVSLLAPGRPLELMFETPDARRPSQFGESDSRMLALAFLSLRLFHDRPALEAPPAHALLPISAEADVAEFADTVPVATLMETFESLGENCEFGRVQRRCGAEPLSLLRFAAAPLPHLLDALEGGFAGMAEPDNIQIVLAENGREFRITDRRYGLWYHAWAWAGRMTAEALHRREVERLPILVYKLLESLRVADKIFVHKGMGAMDEECAYPLATLLRRFGPNTLLFVTLADDGHPAMTVEQRAPGFLVAYITRFAPDHDGHDMLLDEWVTICRAALRVALKAAHNLRETVDA